MRALRKRQATFRGLQGEHPKLYRYFCYALSTCARSRPARPQVPRPENEHELSRISDETIRGLPHWKTSHRRLLLREFPLQEARVLKAPCRFAQSSVGNRPRRAFLPGSAWSMARQLASCGSGRKKRPANSIHSPVREQQYSCRSRLVR